MINIPKSIAESRSCKQRKMWRVARQAEKEALAKRGVRLLCRSLSGATPIPTRWVFPFRSVGRCKARLVTQGCKKEKGIQEHHSIFALVVKGGNVSRERYENYNSNNLPPLKEIRKNWVHL